MKRLLPLYFNPIKTTYHYLSLAQKAMDAMQEDLIPIKKLFYALRGLLAAIWTVQNQSMPPTEFKHLLTLNGIPQTVLQEIEILETQKSSAHEKFCVKVPPTIKLFYEEMLKECYQKVSGITFQSVSLDALDSLFKEMRSTFNQ